MSFAEYSAESTFQATQYSTAEPDFQPAQYGNVEPAIQSAHSCDRPGHIHIWPTTGELEIERCEHYCLYCRGAKAEKKWSSAWFLRRHVRETHAKTEFPGLIVSEGWSKRPQGNTRPMFKKQRAPGSNKKRAGTKKDRAALIKVFNQAKQSAGYSDHSYEQFPLSSSYTMPASTAVMNCSPGYLPAETMPSTAWSAESYSLALPATQSPLSSEGFVDAPTTIDPSLALTEPVYQADDIFDMVNFHPEQDKVDDSALGTSVASSDVFETPQLTQDDTTFSELSLSQMLAAAIAEEDAKAKNKSTEPSYFQDPVQDDFATLFSGSHFDTFNSDMGFNDFSLDPAFNFDNTTTA